LRRARCKVRDSVGDVGPWAEGMFSWYFKLPISISLTGSTGIYVWHLEAYVRPPVLGKVECAQAEGAFHGL